jgi:2-iminobutanoate/2-iminopropanoate deaminase
MKCIGCKKSEEQWSAAGGQWPARHLTLTFILRSELMREVWFLLTTVHFLMREIISTKDAPQAIGPYSQAIKANGFVFVSGQVAIDPATQQVIAGHVGAQTERVLRNVAEILKAAGSGLEKVVRSTVFLKDMNDFTAMNDVYARHFNAAPPARSTVEVSRLPKDVMVEIDVIALE